MKYTFTPKLCDNKKSGLTGQVILNTPDYIQRKRLFKTLGVKITPEGKIEFSQGDQFDMLIALAEMSRAYVDAIELKFKDGTELKTFDDLLNDPRCDLIVEEIGNIIIHGVRLGE